MLHAVLRAKIEFFDTSPMGRILNRFSADVGISDENLPLTIYDFSVGCFVALASLATSIAVLPIVLVVIPPLILVFLRLRRIFVSTTRELKRLEGMARSPIFAMISESLNGIATLRSNNKMEYVKQKFEAVHDAHTRAFFAFVASSRWFATQMELLAFTLMAVFGFSSVLFHQQGWFGEIDPAVLGVALTMLLQMTGTNFPWIVRQSAEVTNQIISIERILEYGSLPQEADLKLDSDDGDNINWPKDTSIVVNNLATRYRSNLPLAIKGISFRVRAGQRVGVVGRTGSGKSSLVQALFRILEAEQGSIFIGTVDTSQLGLHKLRTHMSVIPQTPILFSGCSIRENLDPFGKYEETEIRAALKSVHMLATVDNLPMGLDAAVAEGGSNLSMGQRQLLCLSRAILLRNRILILDEPTANVDMNTDRLLQETLKREFSHATVISVAHRLDTIIDYDLILVLGDGKVQEFGAPRDLLAKGEAGYFASMVRNTGPAMSQMLTERAMAAAVDSISEA
jgi:ATP-binding cassette subfamily C (CFTR/MRP) protein 4